MKKIADEKKREMIKKMGGPPEKTKE